jgi:hypothetical protein
VTTREGIWPNKSQPSKYNQDARPDDEPRQVPVRIQLSRKMGWRKPPNTIVVSRPSEWGNPYGVGPEQSAAEAVEKFEAFMARRPEWILAAKKYLRGKNLACWCPLDQKCHADVLLRIANEP